MERPGALFGGRVGGGNCGIIRIIEMKLDKSADDAIKQIREKGYAERYAGDGRPVTLIGINFSSEKHGIAEWKAEAF